MLIYILDKLIKQNQLKTILKDICYLCRPHAKYRPARSVYEEPVSWWRYVYNSVLDYYIKPYTWSHIAEHRRKYKKYKNACIQSLQRPNDTELKLDLQKYEDNLTILNIVIAREHARQELRNRDIEKECQITTMSSVNNIIGETVLSSKDQVQNTTEHNKESRKSISVTNNLSDSKIRSEVQIGKINVFFVYFIFILTLTLKH